MENKQSMVQIWYCRLHIPEEAQLDHSCPNVRTDVDMQRMVKPTWMSYSCSCP